MQFDVRRIEENLGKINRMERIERVRALSVTNDLILVMYALFVTEDFLDVTMFHIQWPEYFHQALMIVMSMLLIVKLLLTCSYKMADMIAMIVFAGVFLMARVVSGYVVLADVLLLLLALKGIPFCRIVKVYFVTVSFLLIVTIIASQAGIIDNLVYHFSERRERRAFGVCYPTDFAAFFVWLSFSWVYIRKEKLRLVEIGMVALAGFGIWYFCDARLSSAILFMSAILFLGVKVWKKKTENRDVAAIKTKIFNGVQSAFLFAMPFCAVAIILLSRFYSGEQELLAKMDSLLSGRLLLGHVAFERFNVGLFGQFVPMVGFGRNTVTQLVSSDYFFLDSSYMSILMCYGIFVLLCVIGAFTYSSVRAKKERDFYCVFIIALIAIDCMVEHHMMEICYNPFLFLWFSEKGRTDGSGNILKANGGEAGC